MSKPSLNFILAGIRTLLTINTIKTIIFNIIIHIEMKTFRYIIQTRRVPAMGALLKTSPRASLRFPYR